MTKLLDIVNEMAESKAQARRLIHSGWVKMNGIKVTNPDLDIPRDTLIHVGGRKLVHGANVTQEKE